MYRSIGVLLVRAVRCAHHEHHREQGGAPSSGLRPRAPLGASSDAAALHHALLAPWGAAARPTVLHLGAAVRGAQNLRRTFRPSRIYLGLTTGRHLPMMPTLASAPPRGPSRLDSRSSRCGMSASTYAV